MNILILETNAMESLSVTDPRTGANYIQDFVGNYAGFGVDEDDVDTKFVKIGNIPDDYYDIDLLQYHPDDYATSKRNFGWWSDVVNAEQELQDLTQKARDMGIAGDDICDALDQPQNDLDDLICAQKQEISELIERSQL